ncbi:putative 5-AMP-activated protein kinase, beta subunit [Schistosoma mansoni]|uniref:putative 5-AMP-activated protein kinase, beta subunit n=1 Tax=Schistosoma mansoni TaxID=6183 RepID=UPI0001A6428D|nr:putative 5-AMP-activated protein kinase, beta subunit [Schistosoma mansoni]|eukprot:XP_018647628.1 putative 5-AMP-activated protein kinase, beta subunit [Schistosoma mansoni]
MKLISNYQQNSGVYVIIDCKPGTHQYKYFIDGAWYHDPTKPTVDNEYGTKNNVVHVRSSDFDVLHALEHDQASSRRRSNSSESSEVDSLGGYSPPGEYGRFIPTDISELRDISTPVYSRHMSITPGVRSQPQPPLLPPHLLQGILNMDTSAHCDPNLLPQPNHVIVNHLYALSIKDGVVVLSVITRFRQKFVSTLFYKPIEG